MTSSKIPKDLKIGLLLQLNMTTTYGIISDIHSVHPQIVKLAIDVLIQEGEADKLILNGDLVGDRFQPLDNPHYLAGVLKLAGESGKETYFNWGSHEIMEEARQVSQFMCSKYKNLNDTIITPKVEKGDHHLIFIFGSDSASEDVSGRNFTFGKLTGEDNKSLKTGIYKTDKGHINYTSLEDVKKTVTEPEKTIVISHVPRLFLQVPYAVDIAYFAVNEQERKLIPGIALEQIIRQKSGPQPPEVIEQIARHNGWTFKRENRGNLDLYHLFKETGITKAVSGHFHESVHRAHNHSGTPVEMGRFVSELFWNGSYLDGLKVGLLSVHEGKVAYENIDLRPYLPQPKEKGNGYVITVCRA